MPLLRRHVLVALIAVCNLFCYADRTNIGLVILEWPDLSKGQVANVLASFFYGYLITQILGGYLAHKYGARWVLFGGVALWTLCDLSTVWSRHSGVMALLMLSRIGLGMGEGSTFLANTLQGQSGTPLKRSSACELCRWRADLGTIFALCATPQIIHGVGWEWVFYVFAILNLAWLCLWFTAGYSSPEQDPHITRDERDYIVRSRRSIDDRRDEEDVDDALLKKKTDVPAELRVEDRAVRAHDGTTWKDWTSGGVIAIIVAHFTFNWGWYVLLSWLPKFFKDVYKIDVNDGAGKNALYLILPYTMGYLGLVGVGSLSDYMLSRKYVTLLNARKICQGVGAFGPGLALLILAIGCKSFSPIVTSAILSFGLCTGRATASGYWTNMLDQRVPASTLMGVSNTIATIPGIVGNLLTGAILHASGDGSENWEWVWGVGAIVYAFGGVFYLIFAEAPLRRCD